MESKEVLNENPSSSVLEDLDPLKVSRFSFPGLTLKLNKIQEMKLGQKLTKELRVVMDFPEDILQKQEFYWLCTHNIECEKQRDRIKNIIETHYFTPTKWISTSEIEIDIRPNSRLPRRRDVGKI